MRQVVQNYRTGELSIAEVPVPACPSGRVLVSVIFSLLSAGTERTMVNLAQASLLGKAQQRPDLVRQVIDKVQQEGLLTTYQKVMNRLDNLSPLGYSCAGVVKSVGDGVTDLRAGDAVACAGAGYASHAEIVSVPRNLAARLPSESVSFEDAAFTTVGAIALQGIRQTAPALGETVAVIGLGLVGQLTVQLLRANGCRVLGMDLNAERCHLAEQMGCGATATSNAEFIALIARWTGGQGADAVVITAATKSKAPIDLAAEVSRDRGRVVAVGLVGLSVPRKPFYEKELDLRLSRSYGPGRYDPAYEEHGQDYPIGYVRWTENRNMQAFLDLLAQGKIDVRPLVTHRFPIERAVEAYDLITSDRANEALGVILTYSGQSEAKEQHVDIVRLPHSLEQRPFAGADTTVARLGLIGAGNFAQGVLLPAMKGIKQARLQAVCSASGLSARHVGEKYGATYCTAQTRQVIEDPGVDAILVATRHGSHAALVVDALKAGKPVFVEKPLALNEEQLRNVVQTYDEAANLHGCAHPQSPISNPPFLMVGFNRRFAPLAVAMREFLAGAGPLLIHYRVNAGYIPPDSWVHDPVEGGGRIIGEACHFVDFLQFVTGASPVLVCAESLRPNGGNQILEDNVAIQITFEDGSVGSILYAANGDRAFPKERVEAFGGGRVAVLDDFRRLEMVKGDRRRVQRSWLKQDKGHAAELETFVSAVRGGGVAPIPFASLVQTTLTTFRIREALRTGQPQRVDWQESGEESKAL
jgi:predicted dehydrogenase/threonine dehydrogenase-like Zn-dependent dehydrogenase